MAYRLWSLVFLTFILKGANEHLHLDTLITWTFLGLCQYLDLMYITLKSILKSHFLVKTGCSQGCSLHWFSTSSPTSAEEVWIWLYTGYYGQGKYLQNNIQIVLTITGIQPKQDELYFFSGFRSMTGMNFLFNLIWIERMVDTFHLMQIKVCEIYMPFIGESCFVFVKCECASINTFICIWLFERCFVMYVLLCENKNLSTHIHDPHFKSWSKTC